MIKIRTVVMALPLEMWPKIRKIEKNCCINLSPKEFLMRFGLPNGVDKDFNDKEKIWFSEIRKLYRKKLRDN